MPEVILPCPACGAVENEGDKFALSYRLGTQVICHKCGMYGPVADDFHEAVERWNILPRALRWTHEPPKVAGWYFQRTAGEDQTINVAYVYSGLAGLYCKCGCRNTPLKCWIGFEWAGPIAPPID